MTYDPHNEPHDNCGLPMNQWYVNPDRCVPSCDDQLPTFSHVGRGLQGNAFEVRISDPDTTNETYLEGYSFDEATKQYSRLWKSENINGGELKVYHNTRPGTLPQCFTMTFIYRRPHRPEWSWTTPAIPYVWDSDGDGNPDVDEVVGSGVANLFIRADRSSPWDQRLVFPQGTGPEDFNAPGPEETWSGNITFGWDGDVSVPNIDDIAKIIGVPVSTITNILKNIAGSMAGSDNVKDYIDDKDKELFDHFHDDLGFPEGMLPGDGGSTSVKKYIDDAIAGLNTSLRVYIDASFNKAERAISDILEKVYGGGTMDPATGAITWPNTDKIAVGNMNLYSGGTANWIKTDVDGENDLKAV